MDQALVQKQYINNSKKWWTFYVWLNHFLYNGYMNDIKNRFLNQLSNWNHYELVFGFLSIILILVLSIVTIDSTIPVWLTVSSIIAGVTGVIATLLIAKQSWWNYWWGFIQIILYGIIALASSIYGDFILNFLFFLPMSIYGLFYWKKNEKETDIVSSKKLSRNEIIKYSFVGFLSFIVVSLILLFGTNDALPWLDSASTIFSIFGMFLMIRAYREQYLIWAVVNIISTTMWFVILFTGNSYALPIAIMYLVFTVIGVWGWINWYKKPVYTGHVPIKNCSTGTKAVYK